MNQISHGDDPVVNAAFSRQVFDETTVDVAAARARFYVRYDRAQRARMPYLRVAGAALAAGALAAVILVAPLRSLAGNVLEIFEPQHITPIALTASDRAALRALPDLTAYGTVREGARPREADAATPAGAQRYSGFPVATPHTLPANVPASVRYHVVGRSTGAFTFSATRAAAAAAQNGAALPPMPANLNGSTIQAAVGPIVMATYGEDVAPAAARRAGARRALPPLAIVQMPVPRVVSDGASVTAIESYLLSMPGIPPNLRRQIAALRDPATTLPFPIDIDRQYARTIAVGGRPGLVVGDDTGLGAGVIWERGAYVYSVFGTVPAAELVALANAMP